MDQSSGKCSCGRNQAVRIPREFKLAGNEVIIRKLDDKLIIEPIPVQNNLRQLLVIAFVPVSLLRVD
ncbi:MAG: AbrB/MazE/SpoVT family DNA-binding domain-containing protein [Gammaproteobacteria bacterium]|nr:AbrB/MazE/SpoVT family DNA-binding domain-containing protein [Gammaproteobacteria bacterium]